MLDDAISGGTPPAQTDHKPKPFRVSTVLGPGAGEDESDPLLLAQISGTEAVSAPYAFDLTILQRTTNADGSSREKIEPTKLINTVASFGISEAENDGQFFNWHDRHGVIDRFEEVGRNPFPNFRCYTARFVPALKLLERERTFRIFEDTDALTAIRSVFQAQGEIPSDYLIVNVRTPLPKLPYIVQFGEDSLAFVHRLMAMHGMWYHFVHELGRKTEQMVLGDGKKQHPTDHVRGLFTADAPERFLVAGYRRVFAPGPRRILLGEFNPLQPKSPFQGRADIDKNYDIATADVVHHPGRAQHRIFPASFQGNEELKGAAKHQMEAAETQIILATGQTKNRALRAGEGVRVFLKQGDTAQKCLVTTLSLHGLDATCGEAVSGFAGFMSLVWKGVNPFSDGKLTDISAAIAQTEMGAFLLDTAHTVGSVAGVVSTATSVFSPISAIIALPDLITKAADKLGPTAAAVTPVTDASTKFLASPQIDFGNTFIGVSQVDDTQDSFLLPPPVATRQTARGPHVAVVIGPNGAIPGGNDLWADALGRVRVRFPWEPPDESGDPLAQPPFDDSQRSAWLRVSEGWAGRGWGTQFLPRIGQEVLVDFVDGDPERPIIVGRLYNAEGGSGASALPFPSPKASSTTFDTLTKLPNTVSAQWPMSGIRTFSTPHPSDNKEKRFNLLRFDDSWQKEQVLIRSQGRLDETSFASTFQTSHADRHIQIGGKDEKTGQSGGSLFTTMGGEDNLHVVKSRYTAIDVNEEQTTKGHLFVDVTGAVKIISQAEINLSAPKIVLEASSKISLKVGSSFVVIDPSGVFINGAQVLINSGGSALSVSDADMTDPLDAGSADPGDPLNWRELHKGGGGGGGHHHHTAKASHGLNVTRNKDGSFQVTKGIKVKGSPDYVSTVIQDLTTIHSTKDGDARMDRIDSSGKQVTIQNYDSAYPKPASPNADTMPGNNSLTDWQNAGAPGTPAGTDAAGNPVVGNGKGSDSTIHYDPADWPDPTSRTKAPGDSILNHELGHADHQTHGTQDMTPNATDTYGNNEEFNNLPNDNSYRRERNPDPSFQRKDYGDF
jgi:uncharacterized protein involved in type VI secretion and phage assembly